jgi:hypothetical protein
MYDSSRRDDRRQSYSSDSSGRSIPARRYRQGRDDFDTDDSMLVTRKRARGWQGYSDIGEEDTPVPAQIQSTKLLTIGEHDAVTDYYTEAFRHLQQSACKIIAKAFVKAIEPKKQTNYPYTKGSEKPPPWWPPMPREGEKGNPGDVRHKEPDHLLKPGKPHSSLLAPPF